MYSAIAANKRKTWIIMMVFIAVIAGLGWVAGALYGEPSFLYLALGGAAIYTLIQYFAAAKIALAINGAKEVSKKEQPLLYRTVENLSIASGLPMPKVYVIDDPAPNAFATGRDPKHAVVAVTTGLMQIMDKHELEAVMAHELGHVKNFDIRVMMLVFGLASAIGIISDILVRMMWFGGNNNDNRQVHPIVIIVGIAAAIIAPLIAVLVQAAISRQREYLADGTSAMMTRYPDALIGALGKLKSHGTALKRQHTASAHLFFANPLKGKSIMKLFSTHPPIEDRIARLQKMSTKL